LPCWPERLENSDLRTKKKPVPFAGTSSKVPGFLGSTRTLGETRRTHTREAVARSPLTIEPGHICLARVRKCVLGTGARPTTHLSRWQALHSNDSARPASAPATAASSPSRTSDTREGRLLACTVALSLVGGEDPASSRHEPRSPPRNTVMPGWRTRPVSPLGADTGDARCPHDRRQGAAR
jgi:hypothetical protein